MPTPRSESINGFISGRTEIRPIVNGDELENRIDHYAVLSQITNTGIDNYFNDPVHEEGLYAAGSIKDLKAELLTGIHTHVIAVLKSEPYATHLQALEASQRQRSESGNRWSDLSLNILAGTGTFVSVTSEVFDFLKSRLGVDTAAHPKNWKIIDRIAKLNIHAFSAFQETYLKSTRFANWSALIEQFEIGNEGQVQFKAGYPGNAPVRDVVIEKAAEWKKTDYIVDGSLPIGKLRDIPDFESAIGCPVTFQPGILEKLWGAYATHAHRISSSPYTTSSGDSAAFPR